MKILSLFDGMSVAQQACKNLGIDVEYYASEIDEYAIAVTQAQHPETKQLGDVCKLGKENPYPKELLEGVDLIVFGSPCTDLSIAKKNREGLKGQHSGLFYEAVRIMKDLKPKYFLMENVNSMSQESRDEITKTLLPFLDTCKD
jgi:site-specific DNA-cytosine methylase